MENLRAAGCVFAEDEARLLTDQAVTPADLDDMVKRRLAGEPLEHILGWVEFCGRRIAVEPGVFVPRRRTEFLADQAAALLRPDSVVVDLCCGTGALGAALATWVPSVELHASDLDPAAVSCARRNLPARARTYEGDLFEPLPATLRGKIDVIVANTPYVPSEAIAMMPPEARLYEGRLALDGGRDGLDVQRRVAEAAVRWLGPGGSLLVEASLRQAEQTAAVFSLNGLIPEVKTSETWESAVVIGMRRISAR